MLSRRLRVFVQTNVRVCSFIRKFSVVASSKTMTKDRAPNEYYVRLRESAKNLAISGDNYADTFKTLDQIGYEHLNECEDAVEKALNPDKKQPKHFPIDTNQLIYMLKLILQSETLQDPFSITVQFVGALVGMNIVKLDDTWIKMIVTETLRKYPNDPTKALDVYVELCKIQPYPKVFPGSMFAIMMAVKQRKKSRKMFEKCIGVLEAQGSTPPHYLEGAVLLANDEALTFLDKLKNAGRKLGADELRRMSKLANVIKEPKILEPLVQLHHLLPDHHGARLELFNTLAVLYGQKGHIEAINVLWSSLRVQIKGTDWHHYKHVFRRCRHFYQCQNMQVPEELEFVLRMAGDL